VRLWPRRNPPPLVCREFVELVTDYLEGRLPGEQRARFETHLAECDGCDGYLDDMRLMLATMGNVAMPSDPHTREVLLRAVRDLHGSS
jgi:predicted anti-sigma-YlaC factor YlaD